MITNIPAHDLALDIAGRSICRDRVGSVIRDAKDRIFSWGWNHNYGPDLGLCAERHAIRRANKKRLHGSIITIARFKPSGKYGISYPCDICMERIKKYEIEVVEFMNRKGDWNVYII